MHKILITIGALLPFGASAATNISFQNFSGNSTGFPIVDNTGVPIDSEYLTLSVGTFTNDFAANVRGLDSNKDDALVLSSFRKTGPTVPFAPLNLPGLFNNSLNNADGDNSLLGQNIFLLVQDVCFSSAQVLVFDLGVTFPEHNVSGNASISGPVLRPGDVAFGFSGIGGVAVNTDKLVALNSGFGAGGFGRGVSFDSLLTGPVCPEPSTSLLLGIAGFALGTRRHR